MANIERWVPILGDGKSPETGWRPDLPDGMRGWSNNGIPPDNVGDKSPAVSRYLVTFDEKHLPALEVHLALSGIVPLEFADGDYRDRVLVNAIRAESYKDKNADTFFDSIDLASAGDAKLRMVKDALLQCVALGLGGAKAEAIRVRLDLPEEVAIGPGDTSGGAGV